MNMGQILELWPLLVGAASIAYSAVTARSKVNAEHLTDVETRHTSQIDGLQRELSSATERLSLVEQAQRQMPTHSDLTEIQGRISGVAKSVDEMRGEMRGANRLLDNIHQVLLREHGS